MAEKTDDLDAVRSVVTTLTPFKTDERERILRWVREKLGMSAGASGIEPAAHTLATQGQGQASSGAVQGGQAGHAPPATDIKTFVTEKNPTSDVHFAATVAYYHQFIAPSAQRKDSITKQDVINACRLVPRRQPKRVDQLLVNTYSSGFFDRGEAGHYKLNAVGENLVAMTLPGDGTSAKRKRAARGAARKTAKGSRKKR